MRRADWLAQVLRGAGLNVREYDGWQARGRDFADLTAVVWHHDASPPGDSPGVPAFLIRQMAAGRPSAQLWVDRAGGWHVLAAGVTFHAGAVRSGMPGNDRSLGVETDHTTGEPWPPAQLDGLRRGTAAILVRLGVGPANLHFHKSICAPPGRKSDPDGLDLAAERRALQEDDDMTPDQARQLADIWRIAGGLDWIANPPGGEAQGELLTLIRQIKARLDALESKVGR